MLWCSLPSYYLMKLYESAFTYLPFIYLLLSSAFFGILYHNANLIPKRPYTVLVFFLFNTFVYKYYPHKKLVRFSLQKHFWKTCSLAFYAILVNNIHELLFFQFHFKDVSFNLIFSFLYVFIMFISSYVLKSDSMTLYTNILFLFFPIKCVWQINLYVYTLYVTCAIFLTYSCCTPKSIIKNEIKLRPIIKFFPYLRIHDAFILAGLLQLFIEYKWRYIPDQASADEIERILQEEMEKVNNDDF